MIYRHPVNLLYFRWWQQINWYFLALTISHHWSSSDIIIKLGDIYISAHLKWCTYSLWYIETISHCILRLNSTIILKREWWLLIILFLVWFELIGLLRTVQSTFIKINELITECKLLFQVVWRWVIGIFMILITLFHVFLMR